MSSPNKTDTKWRFMPHQTYGVLGWIETLLKGLACAAAFVSISQYNSNLSDVVFLVARIVATVMLGLLQGIYTALMVFRFLDGELFAIAFSILLFLANFAMLIISIYSVDPSQYVFVYAFLMLLGEFVKMMFLFLKKKEEFSVRFLNRSMLWAVSGVMACLYVVILICEIYLFFVGYNNNHGR